MIITLIILMVALSYGCWNLLKKVEKYEEMIQESDAFIQSELTRNEALLEALRQIDNRQMFEKDDDVGSIFYQIKQTIERFKKI